MDGTPEHSEPDAAFSPLALTNLLVRDLANEPQPSSPFGEGGDASPVRSAELSASQMTLIKVAPYGAPIIKATGVAIGVILIAAAIAFAVVTGR